MKLLGVKTVLCWILDFDLIKLRRIFWRQELQINLQCICWERLWMLQGWQIHLRGVGVAEDWVDAVYFSIFFLLLFLGQFLRVSGEMYASRRLSLKVLVSLSPHSKLKVHMIMLFKIMNIFMNLAQKDYYFIIIITHDS